MQPIIAANRGGKTLGQFSELIFKLGYESLEEFMEAIETDEREK